MSDKNIISLKAIIESIEKIEKFTSGISGPDDFNIDEKAFDAVMMNFIIIGEMVSRLSDDFKNTHKKIEWDKIKAFRNIAAHNYFGIDIEEVWQIINNKLPGLKKSIAVILNKEK